MFTGPRDQGVNMSLVVGGVSFLFLRPSGPSHKACQADSCRLLLPNEQGSWALQPQSPCPGSRKTREAQT